MVATHIQIADSIDHSITEAWTEPLYQVDVLVIVRDNGMARGHAVRRADQKVQHPAEVFSNVLIHFLHLEGPRVGVAREETPIPDRADVASAEGLREAIGVEMLDNFPEQVTVGVFICEGLA